MTISKEEASKQVAEILDQVDQLLANAEALADEAGIKFTWSTPGDSTQYYYGKDSEEWTESIAADYGINKTGGYWMSSSDHC